LEDLAVDVEELKRRLVEEVKLRAYDDRYIDRAEEKEILKTGIEHGLSLEVARSALIQVCERLDYTMESILDQKAKEMLDQFASNDGQVDKKEFDDTAAVLYKASKGRLSEARCRKKAKEIILANEWKVREGFMKGGNWFEEI
jgi:hypothetical protein